MKKIIFIALFSILLFSNIAVAQSGLINPDQFANINVSLIAGESISSGDIGKIVYDNGAKVYGFNKILAGTECSGGTPTDIAGPTGVNSYADVAGLTSTTFASAFYSNNGKIYTYVCSFNIYTKATATISNRLEIGTCGGIFSIVKLTSTTYAISYMGTSNYLETVVCTFNGVDTVSKGTIKVVNSQAATNIDTDRLSDTSYVIAHTGASSYLDSVICTYNSGDGTVACGTIKTNISEGNTAKAISVAVLTSTRYLIAFGYGSSYYYCYGCNISGTTISVDSATSLGSTNTDHGHLARLTDTAAAFAYHSTSTNLTTGVVTYDSVVIKGNVTASLTSSTAVYINVLRNSDTTYTIVYKHDYIDCRVCTYNPSTTNVTSATGYNINAADGGNYLKASSMSVGTSFICGFIDGNNYMSIMGGWTKGNPIMLPVMANSAVASGDSGYFTILKPYTKITNSDLSLTAGLAYYYDFGLGSLSTTEVANYYLGYALSTNEIFIDQNPYNQEASATRPISLHRK